MDYFGWDSNRFSPGNPRGSYHHADFDIACATILQGIRTRQGFILLTGEAGLGKSLILQHCMAEADDIRFILLGDAQLDFPDILDYLCADLGLRDAEPDVVPQNRLLLDALAAYASRGQPVALLVDDAHHLSISALLGLWEFAETSAVAADQRLQVVLAGLPEIETKLRQPELRPLHESIRVRYRLTPLSELETGLFVDHLRKVAGHVSDDLLSSAVVERIACHTRGIPRAIVKLCAAILSFARLHSECTIMPAMVDEVARIGFFDGRAESPEPADVESPIAPTAITPPSTAEVSRRRWSPGTWVNGLALAVIIVATVIWLWPSERVAEDQSPLPHSLGQREQVADLPAAGPPTPAGAPVPAPDSTESGAPAPESRLLPPAGAAAAPLTPEPVFATSPETSSKARLKVTRSRVDQTRSRSSASPPRSRTTGQQASRIQSQPRKGVTFRKGTRIRRGWTSTVPYPWEKPTTTGFNQK